MSESFCEHIKSGKARPYQRIDIAGVEIYNCWKCSEKANVILNGVDELWDKLNKIVYPDKPPHPLPYNRTHNGKT